MASFLAPYGNRDALEVARDLDGKVEDLFATSCSLNKHKGVLWQRKTRRDRNLWLRCARRKVFKAKREVGSSPSLPCIAVGDLALRVKLRITQLCRLSLAGIFAPESQTFHQNLIR